MCILPRNSQDPYKIWISEIILQQTQVIQGLNYYLKFVENFPTVTDLANAPEDLVMRLWQGLGYYSRARNLHATAKIIHEQFNGEFPKTYLELIKLKGIGDYTASAIASICFNEPTAVVDGNVYRVLSRYFGIDTPINTSKGIKEFKLLAQELINTKIPGTHNQAVMEFGATLCKPQNPDCNNCPLNTSCVALSKNTIKILPLKEKKLKIRKRYFNYLVIQTKNNATQLVKREKGIWLNMYQFPLVETEKPINQQELIEHKAFNELFDFNTITIKLHTEIVKPHKLSHQHIYAKFWIIKTPNSLKFSHSWNDIKKYPVPVLIDNFLNEFNYN